jgi:hypothetical protein
MKRLDIMQCLFNKKKPPKVLLDLHTIPKLAEVEVMGAFDKI